MNQAIKSFGKYLSSKNLKLTKEREIVLTEIFLHPGHLEAEDLWHNLRKKNKRASRATVYRTLDLLVDSGMVRKVDLGHGHSHFEHVLGHAHHEHMVCLKCGKVIEFSDKEMEGDLNKLCKKSGFEHTSHRFEIFGRCGRCRKSRQRYEVASKFKNLST
jgi:Fur family ferric uptake transcriptional regulator